MLRKNWDVADRYFMFFDCKLPSAPLQYSSLTPSQMYRQTNSVFRQMHLQKVVKSFHLRQL